LKSHDQPVKIKN